jgi:putative methyltransferase
MKKISLVQVNFPQGPTSISSYYLPYSIGCLWAYAEQNQYVRQNYTLDHVLWRRQPVEQTAQQLKDQQVVGFSCYVWNRNWNYSVAQRIKQLNPQCIIVFGGPEPAITDPDLFAKHPFIDAVIKQEGEISFCNLLCDIDHLSSVPGLHVNISGKNVDTGLAHRIQDLAQLPSPYLSGFFDRIIAEAPEVHEWSGTLETNRGCPYACTFCDWGSLTYNKVRQFPLQKVLDEITWMGQNRVAFLSIADANFGMFVERDNTIVDHYLDVQKQYTYPNSYVANYAKNQRKDIVDLVAKLIQHSTQKNVGLQISLQTLNDDVLGIIKRKNLKINDCEVIFRMAEEKGIPIGTELILGLPGETLSTWKNNYWRLFDMNLHHSIDVYINQLLENSEMNLTQKEVYGIETAINRDYFASAYDASDIDETIEITVATAAMPLDDFLQAATINWFLQTFHMGGFSNWISRFVRCNQLDSYEQFYEKFYSWLEKDSWFVTQRNEFQQLFTRWQQQGTVGGVLVNGVALFGWNMYYKTLYQLHANPDQFNWALQLVSRFTQEYSIDSVVLKDLEKLQSLYPICYPTRNQYPRVEHFDHNLYQHIVSGAPLQSIASSLTFDFPEDHSMSELEFLERLMFRRRRNFGKSWITNEN